MIHNRLELFNELCFITMQYLMIFFIPSSGVDPEVQWKIGDVTMGLVGFVFLVNFIVLIYLTVSRIMLIFRVRKAKQAFLKAMVQRNALEKINH